MNRDEIYRRVSSRKGRDVAVRRSLCFYNPAEVLAGVTRDRGVTRWLSYIGNHYVPPTKDVLLIYPCSAEKPYHKSRSYKQLYATLSRLGEDRKRVHVVTVSEPFGLVPEEFYGKKTRWHDWRNDWYDCPGLFQWWCRKHGTHYSQEEAEESIQILAGYVALFLKKVESKRRYKRIIAFVRTRSSGLKKTRDQTHRRILEQAASMSGVKVQMMPRPKLVSRIVKESGPYGWDMYGVAHPKAQDYLYKQLRLILNG